MVEVGKAQEAVDLYHSRWDWPIVNDLDLSRVHMQSMFIQDVS
jgi:hypothetical protein